MAVAVAAVFAALPAPAAAQRFAFERSFDVVPGTTLDASTVRGRIDISVGESTRVQVIGTVTVRVGWDVTHDAADIARGVADHPPVEAETGIIRLRPPATRTERRAVTVSYDVKVPRRARVLANSDSGAITIRDVAGPLSVSTQSGTIALIQIGANAEVKTGSGAVQVDGIDGALQIATSSSAITAGAVRGSFHARTTSGEVQAFLTGSGESTFRQAQAPSGWKARPDR